MDLMDIHAALAKAQDNNTQRVALVNANFKLNPFKKEMAEQICYQNATTLSAFLRECVDGLIRDYAGEKAACSIGDEAV